MEYFFDKVRVHIADYLFCDKYDRDDCFYIDFSEEDIIRTCRLEDMGYDLNDDGTVYRDSNGRPVSTGNNHCHLVDDVIMIDESGKRVPNEEYIVKLISEHFGIK